MRRFEAILDLNHRAKTDGKQTVVADSQLKTSARWGKMAGNAQKWIVRRAK